MNKKPEAGIIKNPVIPGFYSDPSLCRDGEDYYAVFSSFEFFPGVPVFHSRDLVNWRQITYCLSRRSQLELKDAVTSDGIYAPTLRRHSGTWYMITSNRCSKEGNHFYVSSPSMSGPFSGPVWITNPDGSSIDGVDPSLFFDEDGQVYFSCVAWDEHGQGIGQARVDLQSGRLLEPLHIVWHGTGGTFPEGPHTYRINGWYYLMIAEGGTEYGHKVSIARSRKIDGPYESCPRNPILTQNYQYVQSGCIQGVGHGDLFEAHDGTWWIIVHGFRTSLGKLHHLGRETMLAPVSWDADGWPVVSENGWLDETIPLHGAFSEAVQEPVPGFRDDFSDSSLSLNWNFLRNPDLRRYHLQASRGKGLALTGTARFLDQEGSPVWLGTRQRHFDCQVHVNMSFSPGEGDEAGLTVYQTPEHHYDIAVTSENGKRVCFLRKTVGDIHWEGARIYIPAEEFMLHIRASRTEYEFSVSFSEGDGMEAASLGSGRTQLLSTEAMQYQNFTGTYFAVYAQSASEQPAPALFSSFEYCPE